MENVFEILYFIIAILLTAVISAVLIISLISLIKETFKNK
jgi:hypothetical protein